MKRIAIIGASDFQNRLILKAKEMGYETHVFAWREGAVGERTADRFYPISIVEKEKILDVCREIQPCAVASIGSDLAVHTVTHVAGRLGLTCNSEESVLRSTNKYEMRRAMKQAGVHTPGFALVGEGWKAADIPLEFPVIVKPTDRSGSRGVTRVEARDGLKDAIEAALRNSFEKRAIVEEFIEGEEFSCESISWEGKHTCLAVTRKFTTGSPHFIETGHMEPSGLDPSKQEKVFSTVKATLDALGVRYGASHAEFRIDGAGSVGMIEVGARMGGDCIGSDLVQISTGYDFTAMVIDVASGRAPSFVRTTEPKVAAVRFIMNAGDLTTLENAKTEAPEAIYRISEIEQPGSRAVTDSSTRFGYFILSCGCERQALSLANLEMPAAGLE